MGYEVVVSLDVFDPNTRRRREEVLSAGIYRKRENAELRRRSLLDSTDYEGRRIFRDVWIEEVEEEEI